MHKGEMGEVDEVLHPAWRTRRPVVGRSFENPELRIVELGEGGHIEERRFAQAHPDEARRFGDSVAVERGVDLAGQLAAGRHVDATAFGVIGPPVIGAAQTVVLDGAERECRASVQGTDRERPAPRQRVGRSRCTHPAA